MERLGTIVGFAVGVLILGTPVAVEAPMFARCTQAAIEILERADPHERQPPAWLMTAVDEALTSSTLPLAAARMSMHNSRCNGKARRTVFRMFETIGLSTWWRMRFSREELVGLYASQVWMGARPFGLAAASRRLFGRELDALSPDQQRCLMQKLQTPNVKRFSCGGDVQMVKR